MRKQTPIPKGVKDKLCKMLKSAKNKSEFQKVQCIWLRAEFGFDSEIIGRALGWNPVYVRQIHAQFLRQGDEALRIPMNPATCSDLNRPPVPNQTDHPI